MTLMQHIGFIIGYIFLVALAFGLAAITSPVENKFLVKLDYIEDSVVVNRVVRCFSDEREFGIVDTAKVNEETLVNCMGDKYLFDIRLTRSEGSDIRVETGNPGQVRVVKRYVVLDGKPAKLEVNYDNR